MLFIAKEKNPQKINFELFDFSDLLKSYRKNILNICLVTLLWREVYVLLQAYFDFVENFASRDRIVIIPTR